MYSIHLPQFCRAIPSLLLTTNVVGDPGTSFNDLRRMEGRIKHGATSGFAAWSPGKQYYLKGYPLHYKKVTSQIDHIRDMLSIFYFIEKTSSRVHIFNFLVFLAPHDFLTRWCQAWP